MFDSLYVQCKCGTEVEFQTKAGDCTLSSYRIGDNVPTAIAGDLIGKSENCQECGATITLRGGVILIPEHRLTPRR